MTLQQEVNMKRFENTQFNPEQIEAITHWGENILVSASAGSGKTRVLIERILYHIEERGIELNELLVVTFTEAAAGEMKERLESSLKQAFNKADGYDARQHLHGQINQLSTAHIRTLHSFCLQVVQNFFYLIDFNPNFQLVTDETQLYLIYEEVWQDLIEDITSGKLTDEIKEEELHQLMYIFSDPRNDTNLFEMVLELFKFAMANTEPIQWIQQLINYSFDGTEFPKSHLFQDTLGRLLRENLQFAEESLVEALSIIPGGQEATITKYDEFLRSELGRVQKYQSNFADGQLDRVIQGIQSLSFSRWPSTTKNHEDYELVQVVKTWRDTSKDALTKLQSIFKYPYEETVKIEQANQGVIQSIGRLTMAFTQAVQAYKRSQNLLEYNDLEHLTLDILAPYDVESQERIPSSAATYYQALFQEVMVDEYQDINDIQGKILSYLSRELVPDRAGNLFMVGDVKQSIYGFRMAEPALFLRRYQAYQSGVDGHLIILGKNYRSRHEVLQFTNYLFQGIMDPDFGEMEYGVNEALRTGNLSLEPAAPDPDFGIDILLYEKDSESDYEDLGGESDDLLAIDQSLEGEAHLIAQSIQNQMARGRLVYEKGRDGESGRLRPLDYSDIVILSSTKKPFAVIQRVFEQYQIPLLSQNVETYFQRQEIQLMVALLKIIDNPIQDIPLVAVLRSYFVGFTDEELSQIRIAHPQGDFYHAYLSYVTSDSSEVDLELQNRLKSFHQQLLSWQELAKRDSLVELIWTIYIETQFLEYNAGLPNGRQRQANLHALYERASRFEASQFKGIAGFIRYIEKVMGQDKDLAEPIILNEDENFVRMMTVHASKGLEFPMVYLMNANKSFNMQDLNKKYIASKDYGLATDYYDVDQKLRYYTITKDALKELNGNKAKAEEMRKLYVALTRCEQKLYIVGSTTTQDKWEEGIDKIQGQLSGSDYQVPVAARRQSSTWLTWIQQIIALNRVNSKIADFSLDQIQVEFFDDEMISQGHKQFSTESIFMDPQGWMKANLDRIDKVKGIESFDTLMTQQYFHKMSTQTSSYQSVSELKRRYEEPPIEKSDYFTDRRSVKRREPSRESLEASEAVTPPETQGIRYTEDTFTPPSFIESAETKKDYALIGSITHLIMQELDYEELSHIEVSKLQKALREQIMSIAQEHQIEMELIDEVNVNNIQTFLNSSLGQLFLSQHQVLEREHAFSLRIPAETIFVEQEGLKDDCLLIHGVIDAYLDMGDHLILVDFKTNRYKPYGSYSKEEQVQNLEEQYRFQMSLYKEALEVALKKPVEETYLALLDFQANLFIKSFYNFDK